MNFYILGVGIALIVTGLVMLYHLYRTRPGHRAYLHARQRQVSMPALSPRTAKEWSPDAGNR